MAKAARSRRQREPRRRGLPVVRKVLDVTLQQLAQVGFERLSVPEIAADAGVNKTSVYRRWPTKVDLVRAALDFSLEHPREAPDTGALRSDLIALARQSTAFIESPRGKGVLRMLFAEGAHPEVRRLAASTWDQEDHQVIHAVIRRAIRRRELPRNTDVSLILFTIAGALLHRAFVEQQPISAAFVERVVDLVLVGAQRDIR
jgi:AcrR family transcriptional regulator